MQRIRDTKKLKQKKIKEQKRKEKKIIFFFKDTKGTQGCFFC